jgi:hypothetical protein
MSDYYLADLRAEERERQRRSALEAPREAKENQNMKVTLLGDFQFPSSEPRGCDPYNASQGNSAPEAWRIRRYRG